jgi:pimeloyl-ACP methyl ester carboxylesterase
LGRSDCGAKRVNALEKVLPNLRQKLIIDGAGHWVQQERPDEVNAALIAFLKFQIVVLTRFLRANRAVHFA